MKKTRGIFYLSGEEKNIRKVMKELQFRGMTVIKKQVVSKEDFVEIFSQNKSILCTGDIPDEYIADAIYISVVNENDKDGQCLDLPCIELSKGKVVKQFLEIADDFNVDVGENKSNDYVFNTHTGMSVCKYCNHLIKSYPRQYHEVIYESNNFIVVITLGQFIKGYLLIVPKRHVMSFSELNELELEEFMEVYSDVKYMLNLTYGCENFLVWENGTGNSVKGKTKGSIAHAHMHIAPSELTCTEIEEMSNFKFETIRFEELLKFRKSSYLLIKSEDDFWKINNDENLYIPIQYVRKILAHEYTIYGEEWDWRKYRFEDLMEETFFDITNTLSEEWNILPKRIRRNTINFLA